MTTKSMATLPDTIQKDRFGNSVDPVVGYARGKILSSPVEESLRVEHAFSLTRSRASEYGKDSLAIFTGMAGTFPIDSEDIALCNEWAGSPFVVQELRDAGLAHLGGSDSDGFSMFARSSAALVGWCCVTATDGIVLSVVPEAGHSHASVGYGAALARAQLVELTIDQLADHQFNGGRTLSVVVTAVTSGLEWLTDTQLRSVVEFARAHAAPVLIDDAYGARIRPVLYGGGKSLTFGADVVLTNTDKAGMRGPRGALVAGRRHLVAQLAAWAAERGMDARAPLLIGALRALQRFDPSDLLAEADQAQLLGRAVVAELGTDVVHESALGPTIREDDVLELLTRSNQAVWSDLVPCEAAAAVGMTLLRRRGIITVNTHAQPGARVSLRLKPVLGHLTRAGGADAVAKAIVAAIDEVAELVSSPERARDLLLGA